MDLVQTTWFVFVFFLSFFCCCWKELKRKQLKEKSHTFCCKEEFFIVFQSKKKEKFQFFCFFLLSLVSFLLKYKNNKQSESWKEKWNEEKGSCLLGHFCDSLLACLFLFFLFNEQGHSLQWKTKQTKQRKHSLSLKTNKKTENFSFCFDWKTMKKLFFAAKCLTFFFFHSNFSKQQEKEKKEKGIERIKVIVVQNMQLELLSRFSFTFFFFLGDNIDKWRKINSKINSNHTKQRTKRNEKRVCNIEKKQKNESAFLLCIESNAFDEKQQRKSRLFAQPSLFSLCKTSDTTINQKKNNEMNQTCFQTKVIFLCFDSSKSINLLKSFSIIIFILWTNQP